MRAFVVVDASKRKSEPAAILFWKEDGSEQGLFSLELSPNYDWDNLPKTLEFCAGKPFGRANAKESERWVLSRIHADGLAEHRVVDLLATSKGRSADDAFLSYEIDLPEEITSTDSFPRASDILSAVERMHAGGEAYYAYLTIRSTTKNAAQIIAGQIRDNRKAAGLTQTQLAARAGITQTVMSRTESGRGNPTLSLLEEIAAALDMELVVKLQAPSSKKKN